LSHSHKIVTPPPPRPPTLPHLRVVPPPLPPPPPKLEELLEYRLEPDGNVSRAYRYSRDKVQRAVDHLRLWYQLNLMVEIEALKRGQLPDQAKLNKWLVSSYKLVGFTVLTVIVLALVAYLGANVFYWFSSSWVEPTVIEATDERVLQLSAQLAQQSNSRDKIAADLADAERVIAMHEQFLDGARQALREQLDEGKGELLRLQQLGRSFVSTRAQVRASSAAFTGISRKRLGAEYRARLIDRESAVTGAMQLSQIAQGNLSLAERQLDINKRRDDLRSQTETLAAILDHRQGGRHSLEMLRTVQEIRRAEVELAKSRDLRDVLRKSLERFDKIVTTIESAPLLRAVAGKDVIAFVPYENLDRATAGAPLYACWLGPLFCRRVGQVTALLPGEMLYKHPLHNNQLRGQPVQVQLTDKRYAERKVLFAGGRPLLF
jgi:Tfp pilus assembly protein PilV